MAKPDVCGSKKDIDFKFVESRLEEIATPQTAIYAASIGNVQLLRKIIEFSPTLINTKDWTGSDLLMLAAIGDHDDILQFLLSIIKNEATNYSQKIIEKNSFHQTALDLAKKHQSLRILKLLTIEAAQLSAKPEVSTTKQETLESNQTPKKYVYVTKITDTGNNLFNYDIYNSICSLLDENKLEYRVEEHEPPYTCPSEAKSILMKIDESFHLFGYNAARRINSKLIKKHFNAKKMRFATSEELFNLLKLIPGAVPTFGEPILPLKLFLDDQLLKSYQEITFSLGTTSHYAIMNMSDYLRIVKYESFEFSDE